MASGWANDDAVNEQINSTIEDEECGEPIPEARRKAVPGVRLCIACQQEKDSHNASHAGYNRRGSKDSQLR